MGSSSEEGSNTTPHQLLQLGEPAQRTGSFIRPSKTVKITFLIMLYSELYYMTSLPLHLYLTIAELVNLSA